MFSRNWLGLFTGIATMNKEMYIDIIRRLKEEGEAPLKQQLIFPSQQCSITPDGFGQGFIIKELCHITAAFTIIS
jgi:hypothetical protein